MPLFDTYDYCEVHGIGVYGGGMFEQGPGRGQLQYLASLFHPDAPNDIAPPEYNIQVIAPDVHPRPAGARAAPDRVSVGKLRRAAARFASSRLRTTARIVPPWRPSVRSS